MIPVQYSNSVKIQALANYAQQWFNSEDKLNLFYGVVMNLDTASGYGLDVWGRIVGANRYITLPDLDTKWIGWNGTKFFPFNQGFWYSGQDNTLKSYRLSDPAYRRCILLKAMLNISTLSCPQINQALNLIFGERGASWCEDLGNMAMALHFRFSMEPWEIAVIQYDDYCPKPAGVILARIEYFNPERVVMWRETGYGGPWGERVFQSTYTRELD